MVLRLTSCTFPASPDRTEEWQPTLPCPTPTRSVLAALARCPHRLSHGLQGTMALQHACGWPGGPPIPHSGTGDGYSTMSYFSGTVVRISRSAPRYNVYRTFIFLSTSFLSSSSPHIVSLFTRCTLTDVYHSAIPSSPTFPNRVRDPQFSRPSFSLLELRLQNKINAIPTSGRTF
ncbi:hypothetical protein Hypma_014581 [Hypsizygus marmoreus]|uniref:Uncharacterized protein n=1 Tax=Hypsizygus marmoreus TaxID=39966 RepID=A0A369JHB2_HYPMA|nr:hypothetical protein Hypma_014581 [Hypsizygus marmoreus]